MQRQRRHSDDSVPKIGPNGTFKFTEKTTGLRLAVEWLTSNGIICDLDLVCYFYDERARFIEKLTFDNPVSFDGSSKLEADIDSHAQTSSHQENVHIDFSGVDPRTAAILLFIDGGPRNFQFVQRVVVHCTQENLDKDSSNFMSKVEPGAFTSVPLFQTVSRTRKDYQGVALSILYKDGWNENGTPAWQYRNIFDPVYVATGKEKDEKCMQIVVSSVPSLDLYRPRLFASVKAICSALSSTALPKLKQSFLKSDGLDITHFTAAIFAQLYESYPTVIDESEAAYTVAMLQDMFSQIDFNGDGAVDWDEFTTFCIHAGLVGGTVGAEGGNALKGADKLDDYVIEYSEDKNIVDTVLSSYIPLSTMRYAPETKRLMVMQDKGDVVHVFSDRFELMAKIEPSKLVPIDAHDTIKIHDCCFIPSKDLYAYCASDHTIVTCREQCSLNGKKIHYCLVNKITSSFLHVKLCWSEKSKILCSVAQDNIIYGWDIDLGTKIFHLIRHKDMVTDFLAIDVLDLFATCSLDKRIVLWSQGSRRVKGVLLGHERGVRCMSFAKGVLLSAGYECEAKTWDLALKEATLILRGHRMPIATAKIMCTANQTEDNLRAVTVDDSGEFRLWNIFVKEKGSHPGLAQVLQVFKIHTHEPQVARIRFMELPFDPKSSQGYYSNIIAGSTKLVHLLPEKNAVEFIPPTCVVYSEPTAAIVTGVGKNMFKYDICSGSFQSSFCTSDNSDISSACLDGTSGRRLYIGYSSGRLMLVNFATGAPIDTMVVHSKEIMSIVVMKTGNRSLVFTGSMDGRIRCLEENSGRLSIHITAEQAIGDNCGINVLKAVPSLKLLVGASAGKFWGAWNIITFKRLMLIEEEASICDIEVIYASGDAMEIKERIAQGLPLETKHYLTLAVCTGNAIRIYTMDTFEFRIALTHSLRHSSTVYINGMTLLHCPPHGSVNYSSSNSRNSIKLGDLFVGTSDEGYLIVWDASRLRKEASQKFVELFPTSASTLISKANATRQRGILSDDSNVLQGDPKTVPGSVESKHLESNECNENVNTDALSDSFIESVQTFDDDDSSVDSDLSASEEDAVNAKVQRQLHEMQMTMQRSQSQFNIVTNNTAIVGEESPIVEYSLRAWKAHSDIIPAVVPLHDHGCVITVSLDGYHRIWNMDNEMLGELPLPNITERMKARSMIDEEEDENDNWKFILERIPINQSHKDIAAKLVRELVGDAPPPAPEKGLDRRKAAINSIFIAGSGPGDNNLLMLRTKNDSSLGKVTKRSKAAAAKAHFRASVLRELCAPKDSTEDENIAHRLKEENPIERNSSFHGDEFSQGLGHFVHKSSSVAGSDEEDLEKMDDTKHRSLTAIPAARSSSDSFSPVELKPFTAPQLSPLSPSKLKPKSPSYHVKSPTKIPPLLSRHGSRKKSANGDAISVSSASVTSMRSQTSTCSEKTTKSMHSLWSTTEEIVPNEIPAFSEHSIALGHQQGLIDAEGHKILQRINGNNDKVRVYDRAMPKTMLRNIHMSAKVRIPTLGTVNAAEVRFGEQKDMYKHANTEFSGNSHRYSKARAQHVVSVQRIKHNIKRVGSLVHVLDPPLHEVSLPSSMGDDDEGSDRETKSTNKTVNFVDTSNMKCDEEVRALKIDEERIKGLMDKVAEAEVSSVPDWEIRQLKPKSYSSKKKSKFRNTMSSSQTNVAYLEKKLVIAIKSSFSRASDSSAQKKVLTTRILLPFYKMADVKHFLEIFQKVDADYSGDLDPDEWCNFLTSLNKNTSQQQARTIFNRVDTNKQGYLTINDLIPVVFSNANKEVQKQILKYVQDEISKRKIYGKDFLNETDLETLFEYYDEQVVGFIPVKMLREKIKSLQIPEVASYAILGKMMDMEDDEMVNCSEFTRIFQPYLL